MAYNKCDRFPHPPTNYNLLDPGAYQNESTKKIRINNVPFLSKTPRVSYMRSRLWTEAIYQTYIPEHIPNVTCMRSKKPRFPYEAFSKVDIAEILCKCGIQPVCECSDEVGREHQVVCQAKIQSRLYKGLPPRSVIEEGLSSPSKRDYGFEIRADGKLKRIFKVEQKLSLPFYNADVIESTAFYRGCKWSKWKSSREIRSPEQRPGPADYTIERKPTQAEICDENVRAFIRKSSKQLRYIELVQQRNILDARPGPAAYNPRYPAGTDLKFLGPKTPRFLESLEQRPGPADHWIRRDFDLPNPPAKHCHVTLPEPTFFGVKAARFKPQREEGPSPASYYPNLKFCQHIRCPTAGFGSSCDRFKEILPDKDCESLAIENFSYKVDKINTLTCPKATWQFKSKVIRMKPLKVSQNEPSPADFQRSEKKKYRSPQLQYLVPFYTSEGRFEPWNDWMSVLGKLKTPGPGSYNLEKPRCNPAVCRGPLYRAQRFPSELSQTPSPSKYKIGGGIETILATHNKELMDNIKNQHKFHWEPPVVPKKLTLEEREALLLNKCIAICEVVDIPSEKLSKTPATK